MTTERPQVLIVDDLKENRVAMRAVLEDLDAELVFAASGNEALSRIVHQDFAVVLLDVMMPEMDGFEVASLMRSNEPTAHIPIIFVTAKSRDEQLEFKGYEAGAVDYLLKPIQPAILRSKVDVFLRLHEQQRALSVLAELRRTQEELSRANSDLETFTRSVFHDVQEPARSLRLALDRCREASPTDIAPRLADAVRLAERLTKMIRSLQDYSTVGGESTWIETDLNDTVKAAVANLSARIREAGARIDVGELPTVEGHPSQLNMLVDNLLSNALKFRREGTAPAITVRAGMPDDVSWAKGLDPRVDYRWFSIRDNGIGIAPDRQRDIFGAFVHLQRRDTYEGSHLGLSICRRIVDRHRGAIAAESTLEQGTTIYIALPARQEQFERERVGIAPSANPASPAPGGSP